MVEARDDLQKRALAGPVGTDDRDDLAVVDPERDTRDGREAAKAPRDRINLEEQIASETTTDDTVSGASTSTGLSATNRRPCSAQRRAAGPW